MCEPGFSMEVTTYWPSGEICDMKPNRLLAFSSAKELHRITYWLRMEVSALTGTMPYRPLSFPGPSTSSPIVFPSRENEWQLAQVGKPSIISLLLTSEMYRRRHAMKGIASVGRGMMTPFWPTGTDINGTSRKKRGAPTGSVEVWNATS